MAENFTRFSLKGQEKEIETGESWSQEGEYKIKSSQGCTYCQNFSDVAGRRGERNIQTFSSFSLISCQFHSLSSLNEDQRKKKPDECSPWGRVSPPGHRREKGIKHSKWRKSKIAREAKGG